MDIIIYGTDGPDTLFGTVCCIISPWARSSQPTL